MGLGRFQLKDDGRREIAPRLPFPQSDRSTSPVLKSGATPARPISPNILRPVSPNILRNAEAANAAAVTTGFLVTPQRAGISASVASPTRPLVPVASVTASVEAELSTTSSKAARRLSNPRLAAEAASRAAEAAAKAAARGQLYGLEAVKAIARAKQHSPLRSRLCRPAKLHGLPRRRIRLCSQLQSAACLLPGHSTRVHPSIQRLRRYSLWPTQRLGQVPLNHCQTRRHRRQHETTSDQTVRQHGLQRVPPPSEMRSYPMLRSQHRRCRCSRRRSQQTSRRLRHGSVP